MGRFVGSSINKKTGGGGGAGVLLTREFTRATGISTAVSNNVSNITLGDKKYETVLYNNVGLITGYNETVSGQTQGWQIIYNTGDNLISKIQKVDEFPTYLLSPTGATTAGIVTSVDEDTPCLFTCNTSKVPDGTTIYWSANSTSQVGTGSTQGDFTVTAGIGTFDVRTGTGISSEGPNSLFGVSLYVNSDRTKDKMVGSSVAVQINGTSSGSGGGGGGGGPLTHVAFYNPGSTTWTVPAGVTQARVIVIGGGGAGGQYGGGAGGGAALKKYTNLVPGTAYNLTVGSGGSRSGNAQGNAGSSSSFTGPGLTISASGGEGGYGNNQGSGNSYRSGGQGSNGAINGTGGGGYPYHSSGWGHSGNKGPQADGTSGAGGGGGGGNDNGTGMTGGDGSYFAGGGGGGGADNGVGGDGGDGGSLVVQNESWSAGDTKGFGGGGGGTDGNNASGGYGGDEDGERGQGQNTGTNNNNTGGDGGGPTNNRGEKGVGNGQNAGGGGGGAFGGGGGGAGHSDSNSVAGAGGSGLVYISYGTGASEDYASGNT